MSYFAPYIDETGLHMPTYEERLEDLCSAYRAIFGPEAELSPAVPDYQLLSVLARALDDTSALVLAAYNSRNPAYAQGQALDLLLPQVGLRRRGATYSEAELTLTGTAGSVIPAGSAAADDKGRLWRTNEVATLSSQGAGNGSNAGNAQGTALAAAVCDLPGPVYAAAGTISQIVSPVSGWTGVTNAAESSLGLPEETDAEVRSRMKTALAGQSVTILDGLEAALRAIPYLQKLRILINDGDTADANGVPGHSLAVCVSGGAAPEIARAIFEKKAPGIGTWGTTSETVTDENGESHQIFFSRAGTEMIYPKITLAAKTGFDQAAVTALLRDAVYSYISAMEIGAPMNVPYLYKVCYDAAGTMSDTFAIRSIRVTTTGSSGATYTETVSIAWNKRFMCLKNMIEVEVAS